MAGGSPAIFFINFIVDPMAITLYNYIEDKKQPLVAVFQALLYRLATSKMLI